MKALELLGIFARPLLLVVFPFLLVLMGTTGRPLARKVGLVCAAGFVFIACYPIVAITAATAVAMSEQAKVSTAVLAGAIYDGYQVTDRELHGLDGWKGVDIAAGCGAEIYAPFDGRVTYNGLDGYDTSKGQATMLTISGDGIEVTLLHGDYLPGVGTAVSAGEVIGHENNHGYTVGPTGCHSHVILRRNGQTLNYLDWLHEQKRVVVARIGAVGKSDYAISLSHYDTSKGGTNCDSDCSTMASGDKTATWIGGRDGLFAAACANRPDLGWVIGSASKGTAGTRFTVAGVRYECRDRGGWIRCLEPGELDPAIVNAHSKGYLLNRPAVAEEPYCWVDLMIPQPIAPYGTMTTDWRFSQ